MVMHIEEAEDLACLGDNVDDEREGKHAVGNTVLGGPGCKCCEKARKDAIAADREHQDKVLEGWLNAQQPKQQPPDECWQQNDWNSVETRLPEDGKEVLVLVEDITENVTWIRVGFLTAWDWYICSNPINLLLRELSKSSRVEITHWQPLPPAPSK